MEPWLTNYDRDMDLSRGYSLDLPRVLVPWEVTWSGLQDLLAGCDSCDFMEYSKLGPQPRRVASLRCESLGGLGHQLLINFYGDVLDSFELRFPDGSITDQGVIDFDVSFPLFQRHLEMAFGPPIVSRAATESTSVEARFPECEWRVDDVQISHLITEHWGPVERLTVSRLSKP